MGNFYPKVPKPFFFGMVVGCLQINIFVLGKSLKIPLANKRDGFDVERGRGKMSG